MTSKTKNLTCEVALDAAAGALAAGREAALALRSTEAEPLRKMAELELRALAGCLEATSALGQPVRMRVIALLSLCERMIVAGSERSLEWMPKHVVGDDVIEWEAGPCQKRMLEADSLAVVADAPRAFLAATCRARNLVAAERALDLLRREGAE